MKLNIASNINDFLASHKDEALAQIKIDYPNPLYKGLFSFFIVSDKVMLPKTFYKELQKKLGYKLLMNNTSGSSISIAGEKKVIVKDYDSELTLFIKFAKKYSCKIVSFNFA
ncbi:MAG: hypothetical protein P4L63_03735 [Candidatus Pacebacteria bacterium]|nr:hypothetical protein [Candidatus Paceibacterota bacterium]